MAFGTYAGSVLCQFRDAVTQFAEAEVAPRADEVDKTNTFPIVSSVVLNVLCISNKTIFNP